MILVRKRPITVEAQQLTSDQDQGLSLAAWCGGRYILPPAIEIDTLEGTMTARVGDWIIRGMCGEFYPCKPGIFEDTYERV